MSFISGLRVIEKGSLSLPKPSNNSGVVLFDVFQSMITHQKEVQLLDCHPADWRCLHHN